MPSTPEVASVSVPIAIYLYALGMFHGGKHPRVVSGTVDLVWLMFGLSGLVAFGPVGRVAVSGFFGPEATATAWSAWVASLMVLAAFVARTGRNRLVIYHVEPDQIRSATRDALAGLGGTFIETLHGFEDAASRTSVLVRVSPRSKTAVVATKGGASGPVMNTIRPRIKETFRAIDRPTSSISTAFFFASSLVMLIPAANFVGFDPQGRRAVRTVGRWLRWW